MSALLKRVLTVALVAAGPTPASVASPGGRGSPTNSDFVRKSVYQGLKEDGVPPALAARLAENPDFVPKCPLCWQTQEALKEYGKLAAVPVPKAGHGLPDDLARRLVSTDSSVRRVALRDLVDRYVERGYTRSGLKAEEKAELEKAVKEMRSVPKNPNAGLPNGLKFCPSCDGACRIRPATTP
ncbi:MAG: hypothetical protein JWO38_7983 [Gemmataceae bacterium]|nr:hypothetical protein [Gemmataceae bacterium]